MIHPRVEADKSDLARRRFADIQVTNAGMARADEMLADIIFRMETLDALVLQNSRWMRNGMADSLTGQIHFWIRNAKAERASLTPGTLGRWGPNGYGPAIRDLETSAAFHVGRARK